MATARLQYEGLREESPVQLSEPLPSGRRGRLLRGLGAAAAALAVVALVALASHPSAAGAPRAAGGRQTALEGAQELAALTGLPKPWHGDVQDLADSVKDAVPEMLKEDGWNVSLGSFTAISSCATVVSGTNHVVMVDLAHGKTAKLQIYRPQIELGRFPKLVSADIVSLDRLTCANIPLPAPYLPHMVRGPTAHIQEIIDSVKGQVPQHLPVSGWGGMNLAPYRALSYCGDSLSTTVRVEVSASRGLGDPLYLQLFVSKGFHPVLISALMVMPVGHMCAGLPLLPPLGKYKGLASAEGQGGGKEKLTKASKPTKASTEPTPSRSLILGSAEAAPAAAKPTKASTEPTPSPEGKGGGEEEPEGEPEPKIIIEPTPLPEGHGGGGEEATVAPTTAKPTEAPELPEGEPEARPEPVVSPTPAPKSAKAEGQPDE